MSRHSSDVVWKDRKHRLWWPFSFQRYELRNGRLYQIFGFFSKSIDELLLYRITDIKMKRSFPQAIFGTGTIILTVRGDSDKEVRLESVKHPKRVRDLISTEVERSRADHKVIGREFYGEDTNFDGI